MNWSLQIGRDLFTPRRVSRKAAANNDDFHQLFLRIENQTLRKLPDTGYIVFTIRTHMLPMTLWQDDRDALQSMADMMQNMSPATKLYKGFPSMNRWYAAPWLGWTQPKQAYFTGLLWAYFVAFVLQMPDTISKKIIVMIQLFAQPV